MATMGPSDPDVPARRRSNSFVRMLELEKMCKMQRLQTASTRDHSAPPPPTTRSRRLSTSHPPLSHQTQIMKAICQGSATLPSLSLSIPPPQSPLPCAEQPSTLAEQKRSAKSVTFSEPDDGQSDASSICQSPSWEKYGQRKKKKKRKDQKPTDETSHKWKGKRLTKTLPPDPLQVRSPEKLNPSYSIDQLDRLLDSSQENGVPVTTTTAAVAAEEPKVSVNNMALDGSTKPKGRGFLSAFKLQHSNVSTVQKLVEKRATPQVDQLSLQSVQYETTLPLQQPVLTSAPLDKVALESRRTSSIRSAVSNSTHSQSSQERRNSDIRTSATSSHTRSQSLLTSTLNKLKGPAYLYYRAVDDDKATSNPPPGSRCASPTHGIPPTLSNDLAEKLPKERNRSQMNQSQKLPEFSFPPKPTRANTEPGPDIAPRARPPRTRQAEPRPPATNREVLPLRPSAGRRIATDSGPLSSKENVMARVMAQEKQCHTSRRTPGPAAAASHPSQNQLTNDSGYVVLPEPKRHPVRTTENGIMSPPTNALVDYISARGRLRSMQRDNGNSLRPDPTEGTDAQGRHQPDDDQVSINTRASTVRSISQARNDSHSDGKMQSEGRPIGETTSPEQPIARKRREPKSPVERVSPRDGTTSERGTVNPGSQAAKPLEPLDYFVSFDKSYSPPRIESKSPLRSVFSPLQIPRRSDIDAMVGLFDGGAGKDEDEARQSRREAGGHEGDCRGPDVEHLKGSPTTSAQQSDNDVLDFERLGLSSKAAKVLAGMETESTSTARSQNTDPSHTTSERSASSTCDDGPPSYSPVTTPASSRPQSRERHDTPQPETSQMAQGDLRVPNGESSHKAKSLLPRTLRTDTQSTTGRKGRFERSQRDERELSNDAGHRSDPAPRDAGGQAPGPFLSAVSGARDPSNTGEEEGDVGSQQKGSSSTASSRFAIDTQANGKMISHRSKPQRLNLQGREEGPSSLSLPNSPPADATDEVFTHDKSSIKMSRNHSDNGLAGGGAYLQEARKTAPLLAPPPARALRPVPQQKGSFTSNKSARSSSGNRAEPLAKMLVECCSCHYFHDMPSRVYECMAKPDAVVEDKSLGVSAAITTMVKCPWCGHGMTTQCCSGYAAVVYLKEKLHGQ
ncbi:hypothetical protein F5Y16DRAFT_403508 [Xylariaceae sp. FL0255]|nr:hypothetical protein F5Y16DRAFT_403508 [Xylariaceae sp. FL0255]